MGEQKPQPKWVDGEPICTTGCEHFREDGDDYSSPYYCGLTSEDVRVFRGPCVPAIKKQRNDLINGVAMQQAIKALELSVLQCDALHKIIDAERAAIAAAGFQNVHEIVKELGVRTAERDRLKG